MLDAGAAMIAYEIQTLRDGVWRIAAVLEDRDTAAFEARRIISRERLDMVRVVEEVLDESTGITNSRTVMHIADGEETHRGEAPPNGSDKAKSLFADGDPETLGQAVRRSLHRDGLQEFERQRQEARSVRMIALLLAGGAAAGFLAIGMIDWLR